MDGIYLEKKEGIGGAELAEAVKRALAAYGPLRRVLLVPPDLTRGHSRAGSLTRACYEMLKEHTQVSILPALGTHEAMTDTELHEMYGTTIPLTCFLKHDWRKNVVTVGEVPGKYIEELSEGKLSYPIDVQLNKTLVEGDFDLIISIGQVVPHEVVGMANHSKNLFVGCGGADIINKTHFLGAVYGMERMMGRDHSPVRKVFDYAAEHFLKDLRVLYMLTVVGTAGERTALQGLYIGEGRAPFDRAVAHSQRTNLDLLTEPIKKAVVFLDPQEFRSTWLGNKAIYRTRLAIADGGELIILAPGVRHFGEDATVDRLIRKYGYRGTKNTLDMVDSRADLAANLSAAAHLIHGSSEGRFTITYAAGGLTQEEVEGVGFQYLPYDEALRRYPIGELDYGFNNLCGEDVFFIPNPALGLWAQKSRFESV